MMWLDQFLDTNKDYELDKATGFIHQIKSVPFNYNESYLEKQSTTIPMSYLRIAQIENSIGVSDFGKSSVLEIGPGTGVLMNELKKICKSVDGYDVVNSPCCSLNQKQAKSRKFDIAFFCDVIEHFEDIHEVFEYKFKYAYISVPVMPQSYCNFDIINWRHFKPNEHLWYFFETSLINWFINNNCKILKSSYVEDLLRRRWNPEIPNILSLVVKNENF